MAADLTCVVLDTAAEITELMLDLDLAVRVMKANEIGVDEANQLASLNSRLMAIRTALQELGRPLSALKQLPVTIVRER